MKSKFLLTAALALAISGCYDTYTNEIKDKIQKQFSFLDDTSTLEYRQIANGLYMVKADEEVYFYTSGDNANFIIPAPKAFDIDNDKSVGDLLKSNAYTFTTIYNHSDLKNIQGYAKLDKPLADREESSQASVSLVAAPAPKTTPSLVATQTNLPTSTTATAATSAASAAAVAAGEARISELKEVLRQKFESAKKVNESNTPGNVTATPGKTTPATTITSSPPKQLVKGDQFTYFNGSPVLKVDRNEDGSFVSPEQKVANIKKMAAKIPDSWTINFPAIGEEKRQLFVFTDFTCPFCRKLHDDIPVLNQAGITVRYLFYPRSYTTIPETQAGKIHMDMMRRAWCAPDQGEAMSELFDTRTLEDYKCDTVPEAKGRINFPGPYHHFLGTVFNVEGTPTYFTNDGLMDVGYQGYDSFVATKLKK